MFLILRNRKIIWNDLALRTIILILIFYVFAFGIVVGNFGTAIRHRAKFIIMAISIIAPFLPQFTLSKKSKKSKKLTTIFK